MQVVARRSRISRHARKNFGGVVEVLDKERKLACKGFRDEVATPTMRAKYCAFFCEAKKNRSTTIVVLLHGGSYI